jgi:hypothetical protein
LVTCASVQAVTRVNAEQASKRTMHRPTRLPRSAPRCWPLSWGCIKRRANSFAVTCGAAVGQGTRRGFVDTVSNGQAARTGIDRRRPHGAGTGAPVLHRIGHQLAESRRHARDRATDDDPWVDRPARRREFRADGSGSRGPRSVDDEGRDEGALERQEGEQEADGARAPGAVPTECPAGSPKTPPPPPAGSPTQRHWAPSKPRGRPPTVLTGQGAKLH